MGGAEGARTRRNPGSGGGRCRGVSRRQGWRNAPSVAGTGTQRLRINVGQLVWLESN